MKKSKSTSTDSIIIDKKNVGSSESQIGLLSKKIANLMSHFTKNKKQTIALLKKMGNKSIAIYKKDTNKITSLKCLNTTDEDYAKVCNQWSDKVVKLFDTFPRFDWEI